MKEADPRAMSVFFEGNPAICEDLLINICDFTGRRGRPDHGWNGFDNAKKLMLSHLESVFRLFQCVDVRKGPVPLDNLSFIIVNGETAIQKPVISSIRAPAAQFVFDRNSSGHCGPPIFQDPIKVFWMYC